MQALMDQNSKRWDTSKLREFLEPATAIEAMKTPIGWRSGKDSLFWPHEVDGWYSTKSGYKCLWEVTASVRKGPTTSFVHSKECWKCIWRKKIPERVKHLIWRVKHDVVASRSNLAIKHIPIDTKCPICKREEETSEHIFLLCPWTTPIWHSLQVCSVPTPNNTSTLAVWLEKLFSQEYCSSQHKQLTLSSICYAIWFI